MVCIAYLQRCFSAIVTLVILALPSESRGQIWINPGGVGGPPPSTVSYSTMWVCTLLKLPLPAVVWRLGHRATPDTDGVQ